MGAQVCAMSGLLPPNPEGDDKGCPTRFEYFIKGTVPTQRESIKRSILIDKATGDLATTNQTDDTEMQDHQVVFDGISQWCVDCTHAENKSLFIK